ncbi:transcriptional regulator [Polymorphobacter multimanifer]|uniref:LysR family transcriptional regulator n=1 Tax=Polymorphobacter multimanifer TaxID=1070431 RepID=UPI00166C6DE3|nr:LysR family transcriptional regulator [Polymorphobacter multimanifer]GGI83656.1 transcriptional regulator [Polymorphobacter multimanifer]
MELRQLRHFQEIVRCSSFGQAAEKLNITQPALSKSIRNLERSLGCQLLERHPSGVTPTEYGLVFLDYAALVISELERAVEELNALRGRGRGVVRVGAGSTMMRYLLPQAVRRFMAQAEGNSVSLRQGLTDELMASLRRGDIDIMVGSTSPDQLPDDMRHEAVLQDRIVVVADAKHPLVAERRIALAALAACQWVLPEGNEPEGERLVRSLRREGLAPPRVAVRTGSSVVMAALLKDSSYLSYLPAALISLDPDFAHLVPLDLAEPIWPPVLVGVTYRRRGVMLAPVRRFINRLKDVAGEVPAN